MTDRVEDVSLYVKEDVRPQDDFFRYVNGKWLDTTEIPEDKASYGAFTILHDLSRDNVKAILEKEYDDPETKKAGIFYRKGIDIDERDKNGFDPIKPYLEKIDAISSYDELTETIIFLAKKGFSTLFGFYSTPDRKNTQQEVPHISAGGTSIPSPFGGNRDYYFDEDKQNIRDAFVSMLTNLFGLIGKDNAEEQARQVLEFEKNLAEKHYTQVDKRNPELSYNKMHLSELGEKYPNLDWELYFKGFTDTEVNDLIVDNPAYYELFNEILTSTDLDIWKSYLTARILVSSANYLSSEIEDMAFEFYGKTIQGSKVKEEPWKRVMNLLNSRQMIGELIGKLFVKEHFPPEAKEKMLELVNNLILTLEDRIKGLEWMGEDTKEKALYKLSKFNVKIGYPDVWEDYSDLDIGEEDSYFAMIQKTQRFHRNISFERMYKAPDPHKWFMSPQTVNAYYHPYYNEIVFPAGILRFPFFDMNMSDAENFGGIGMVIGHEITHGYDDKGSMFDGDGNMIPWWTQEDREMFNQKAEHFVEEYNRFLVDGKPLNGKLTLGENIADHGGIKIAYNALQRHYENNPREDDELSSEQKFFMSFARLWRTKMRAEIMETQRMNGPHSLPEARINVTLANIREFHDAWDVKEEDKMHRSPLPVLW